MYTALPLLSPTLLIPDVELDTNSLPSNCLRASVLKEFLADIKPVLRELRNLIRRWNKDCTSVPKRIKFAWMYTSEMKSLQEEVKSLYRRVQELLSLLSHGDTAILRSKSEAEKVRQKKERKIDIKTREKHEAEVRSLLQQILTEKGAEKISSAATSSDTSSWEQLEKEIEAKGLSQAQVKQLMDPIKKEIKWTAAPPQQKKLPSQPKKSKDSQQPSPKPSSGNLNPNGDSSRKTNKSPSPQRQFSNDSPATILVVDRTNGGLSTWSSKSHPFYVTTS